jgi:hypothetical protein
VALEPEVFSEPALRAATDAGAAEELGEDHVIGQPCIRYGYRTSGGESLTTGEAREHVDSCVTPDGIMLREVITLAGRQVRIAQAVRLDRAPQLVADEFGTPGDVNETVSTTEQVTEGRPSGPVVHVAAPAGFHLDRELTDGRQDTDGPLLPFYIASFARGGEFVVAQQLMLRETAVDPWPSSGGTHVSLGAGRSGQLMYHTGFVEVQTRVDGLPVRVLASRPELALNVAGTLRAP